MRRPSDVNPIAKVELMISRRGASVEATSMLLQASFLLGPTPAQWSAGRIGLVAIVGFKSVPWPL